MKKSLVKHLQEPIDALDELIIGWNLKEIKEAYNIISRGKRKIYTEKFRCCNCRKLIGEYSKTNRTRVIKGWASICMACLRDKNNQIKRIYEFDKRITKLEEVRTKEMK